MKYRPILFSTEMVQAIQAGRKTQTRRVVKDNLLQDNKNEFQEEDFLLLTMKQCPYGKVGDVLWVRETYKPIPKGFAYRADDHVNWCKEITEQRWKPSIFMPKTAARIFLKINNIRVERLEDISEEDAINEGIMPVRILLNRLQYKDYMGEYRDYNNPINSFKSLWQSINGAESWLSNPFVWVIEFERIEKPQNFLL